MSSDRLYLVFENHLFNALVEDESTEEFVNRVVDDYLDAYSREGIIPATHAGEIESELKAQVLEMLRKKTYGHFNLAEYRKAVREASAPRSRIRES